MAPTIRLLGAVAFVFMGGAAMPALAAGAPPFILDVDLAPKIRDSALRAERFAVDVPFAASSAVDGTWTRAGGLSTWRHSVRIPTAVSMGFHADSVRLPAGATLSLNARGANL